MADPLRIDLSPRGLTADDVTMIREQIKAAGLDIGTIAKLTEGGWWQFNMQSGDGDAARTQIQSIVNNYDRSVAAATRSAAKASIAATLAPLVDPDARIAEIDSDLATLNGGLISNLFPTAVRDIMKRQLAAEKKLLLALKMVMKGRDR